MTDLEHAVYQTIRYANLFDMPVTVTNVWRALLVPDPERSLPPEVRHQRWHGQSAVRMAAVRQALDELCAQGVVEKERGYYFLASRSDMYAIRQRRFVLAQHKWQLTRRAAAWLKLAPFVRMIALSGSLAVANTKPSSDLDLFVVVQRGHIWTGRLLILLVSQALGLRRKHWNVEAPDKVCLNHYVASHALTIPTDIRNMYTAMLYQHLVPVYGMPTFLAFQRANAGWIKRFLMYIEAPVVPSVLAVPTGRLRRQTKRWVEQLLTEPLFSWVEAAAEYVQRSLITRHTPVGQPGRVSLTDRELAFHPHTKVPGLLAQFAQEEGQGKLV